MVESFPSITSGEKKFITFLVNYIVDTNPGDLQTNLMHMSKYMLDEMEAKCDENLYRKQYGNLKDCILQGKGIMSVFKLDGTAFRFQHHNKVHACYEAGLMEDIAWDRF